MDEILKKLKEGGFHCIATTFMLCEDVFVFVTEEEANRAWKYVLGQDQHCTYGWWYGLDGKYPFQQTCIDYKDQFERLHPIEWLDERYKFEL